MDPPLPCNPPSAPTFHTFHLGPGQASAKVGGTDVSSRTLYALRSFTSWGVRRVSPRVYADALLRFVAAPWVAPPFTQASRPPRSPGRPSASDPDSGGRGRGGVGSGRRVSWGGWRRRSGLVARPAPSQLAAVSPSVHACCCLGPLSEGLCFLPPGLNLRMQLISSELTTFVNPHC